MIDRFRTYLSSASVRVRDFFVGLSPRCLPACAVVLFNVGERPAVLAHPVDPAKPPAAFNAVNKSLRDTQCIRSDFSEEKTIQVLKRPLLSAGSLVFSGRLGLYRALSSPFAQELLVTKTGIAQRDAAGKIESVDVEKQPLAKGFIEAFLLVFSGDDKALADEFELYFDGDASSWSMGFVPKRKPLSRFIASLVISGHGSVLDTLLVSEVNGDKTLTRFANVVTGRELTPDEEKRYFGWNK